MMDHEAIREAIVALSLDATDADDRLMVDRELLEHLPGCDECASLMRDMRELAGDLALVPGAVAVPPSLEDRILESVRRERPASDRQPGRRGRIRVVAVAAAVALVGSLGWNAVLLNRTDDSARETAALRSAVGLAADPTTRTVSLRGRTGGMVLLYRPGDRAILLADGIAPLPEGKLLELWLIKDGKPTPVLTFRPDEGSAIVALPINPATFRAVAVTVEERFEQQPTTEPIYAGAIQA